MTAAPSSWVGAPAWAVVSVAVLMASGWDAALPADRSETLASVWARECPGVLGEAGEQLESSAWRSGDLDQGVVDVARGIVARAALIRDQMASN